MPTWFGCGHGGKAVPARQHRQAICPGERRLGKLNVDISRQAAPVSLGGELLFVPVHPTPIPT